jgi:hypothetical protein
MSNIDANVMLILYLAIIVMIVSMIMMFISIRKRILLKASNDELKYDTSTRNIEYTKALLKFLENFTKEISIMYFYEFEDKVDITKVNEEKIKSLIVDTAININTSIDWDNINDEYSLLNKEFYETYIIKTTMFILKELTKKSIDAVDQ